MKLKIKIIVFILLNYSLFSQEEDGSFSFETEIEVEKDEPRVSIASSRKLPKFPELPIKRDFLEEILYKFDNTVYYVQRRKVVIIVDIEKEIQSFN